MNTLSVKPICLASILLSISFNTQATDPSGQSGGLGYSTSDFEHIDTYAVESFVEKLNNACESRDKDDFVTLFSRKVRPGIEAREVDKFERYLDLICEERLNSFSSQVDFFANPSDYEYGILDFKKTINATEDEPVWFTRLCVYKELLCSISIRAVMEEGELRIDEH